MVRGLIFLIDLQLGDLLPPLSQFNGTLPNKEDVLTLVKTINGERKEQALPDAQLLKALDRWWPEFEEPFNAILANHKPKEDKKRSRDDILEEILELCRSIQRSVQPLPDWEDLVRQQKAQDRELFERMKILELQKQESGELLRKAQRRRAERG